METFPHSPKTFLPTPQTPGAENMHQTCTRSARATRIIFQVIGVLRATVLLGIAAVVVSENNFQDSEVLPSWIGNMMNPLHEKWGQWKFLQWSESQLRDHWFFQWAPDVDGATIFLLISRAIVGLVGLYLACLLLVNLCNVVRFLHGWVCGDGMRPRHSPASRHKQDAVLDLLEKSKEDFPTNIRPIVVLTWPWRGGGLLQQVVLLLLDIGLDVNTIFTFLVARQFWFAAVTTFLVVRSMLKELLILPAWRLRKACTKFGPWVQNCPPLCFPSSLGRPSKTASREGSCEKIFSISSKWPSVIGMCTCLKNFKRDL